MRILTALILFPVLCLPVACSGGGSSAPAATGSDTGPEPEPGDEIPSGIPALPGLAGYDVPENTARGALALADESREPVWASETEDIVVAEISDVIDVAMNIVAVECRTTWCGVVIDLPAGGDVSIAGDVGDRLRELFDVLGIARVTVYRLNGTRWIAVYAEIRRLV